MKAMAGALLHLTPLQAGCLDVSRRGESDDITLPPASMVTIGRKASCDVIIAETYAYVSGEHCRLEVAENASIVRLHDLSANGTFIDGRKVGKGTSAEFPIGSEMSLAKPTRRGGAIKFRLTASTTVLSSGQAADPLLVEHSLANVAMESKPPLASAPAARHQMANEAGPSVLANDAAASSTARKVAMEPVQTSTPGDANAAVKAPPTSREQAPVLVAQGAAGHLACSPTIGFAPPAPNIAVRTTSTADVVDVAPAPKNPIVNENGFAHALAMEHQRSLEDMARLHKSGQEETCRLAVLSDKLRSIRERERPRKISEEPLPAARMPASPFAQENGRIAHECEELREQIAALRLESSQFEQECPALQEQVNCERLQCARMQAELDDERACHDRAEAEASKLRAEVEEATHCSRRIQDEVAVAAARNATLEEQCAETLSEAGQARAAAKAARRSLETRGHALTRLRGAVREHARRVGERIAQLEQSLIEMPAAAGSQLAVSSGSEGNSIAQRGLPEEAAADLASPSSTQSARCRPPVGGNVERNPFDKDQPVIGGDGAGQHIARSREQVQNAKHIEGSPDAKACWDAAVMPGTKRRRREEEDIDMGGERQPISSSSSHPPILGVATSATALPQPVPDVQDVCWSALGDR